jgi:hypothetical protein
MLLMTAEENMSVYVCERERQRQRPREKENLRNVK